ncbi:permease prefix domain 1-containing protein [Agromyces larvae]|uniref:Permease prefix domain 1-containing protein n=1 Tax=Agromyces larvae TaxID=2929802 RepID=A0ABY4BYX1_9MICO|nr:permease prefix domain 1-containing protein [Agromyces larvae]UOE43934.1 permease prefix domain 1-containing protein [Agromyces larvae]
MSTDERRELDDLVAAWRDWMSRRDALSAADVDELESHLRDRIDALREAGLADDEAFLVGVKRLGAVDDLSREYAREHSQRLWKQLVLSDGTDGWDVAEGSDAAGDPGRAADVGGEASGRRTRRARSLWVALALGVGAGLAVKAPGWFGVDLAQDPGFFVRNTALLVLPFLAAYFAWRRSLALAAGAVVAGAFVAVALLLNLYPFADRSGVEALGGALAATELLAAVHAVVVLWLAVGLAYTGGDWRTGRARMDFVRFSGEWFVYYVLIALGGGVLSGLTITVFASIDVDVTRFFGEWVLPCGAAGAVLVAAWLVEAKQRVIENIAPVLTKVFTPLFTLMMLALIVAAAVQWNLVDGSRDLLIAFDFVLVVVLALLVYSYSARDPLQPAGWFERLQLVMLVAAVVIDAIVLAAMLARTGEFGFSANKTASLGLNLILLANLAWAAWLQFEFVRGRRPFAVLERWQTAYIPVYPGWAAVVVVVFPPLFGFA